MASYFARFVVDRSIFFGSHIDKHSHNRNLYGTTNFTFCVHLKAGTKSSLVLNVSSFYGILARVQIEDVIVCVRRIQVLAASLSALFPSSPFQHGCVCVSSRVVFAMFLFTKSQPGIVAILGLASPKQPCLGCQWHLGHSWPALCCA